ncbi:MAG: tetratricopeptide repeat protein, partial [Vulcanimicrobiaceae bacterium]
AKPSPSAAALPTATPVPASIEVPKLQAKLKADPNDKEALAELAGYELEAGKPQDALALTHRLLALGDVNAQAYYLDGLANQSLGNIKGAISDFQAATDREPTNAEILMTLTNLYLQTGQADKAEAVAKRAAVFHPSDEQALLNYGLVLGQEQKFEDARAQFEKAAQLAPKDAEPYVLEASTYVSQKADALAQAEYAKALAIDPADTDALLGKARLQASDHDVKGAIATYDQLLPLVPNDAGKAALLVEEYTVYRDEKMYPQALAVLQHAEATYPNEAAVHLAYGDYDAAIAKNLSGAGKEWNLANGPKRDNPDALQRLAQLALTQGNHTLALSDLERLTQVAPDQPAAWTAYANVAAQNKDYTTARQAFGHAFALSRAPDSLAGIGAADFQLKNYKECGAIFEAIEQHDQPFIKANPELLYIEGKCFAGSGQTDKARLAFTKFKGYVKPHTKLAADVDQILRSLKMPPKKADKPKPKATATPHR